MDFIPDETGGIRSCETCIVNLKSREEKENEGFN